MVFNCDSKQDGDQARQFILCRHRQLIQHTALTNEVAKHQESINASDEGAIIPAAIVITMGKAINAF